MRVCRCVCVCACGCRNAAVSDILCFVPPIVVACINSVECKLKALSDALYAHHMMHAIKLKRHTHTPPTQRLMAF